MIKYFAVLAVIGLFCGCGDREEPSPPPAPEPIVPEQIEPPAEVAPELPEIPAAPEPEVPPAPESRVTPTRAEALGFAQYIPAGAEALVTFHEIESVADRIGNMKLWGAFSDELADHPFQTPEIDDEDFSDLRGLAHEGELFEPGPMMTPLEMFGTEVTLALGEGATERVAAWLDFNRRSTYYQMRGVATALSGNAPSQPTVPFTMLSAIFGSLANTDIYSEMAQDAVALQAFEKIQMPPIYIAVRAKDERVREVYEILSQPMRSFADYNEMVAPVEVTRAGSTFVGYRLIGADFANAFAEDPEFLAGIVGSEASELFVEFLKSREIVILSGILGDYAVLFFGASVDEFLLAEAPQKAMTDGDALAFIDPLLAHPLHGLIYGNEAIIDAVSTSASSLTEIAIGLRDGFAANDRDGRSRDLVALLQIVSEREKALRSLARYEATGITLVDDGGPRIDAHGSTSGSLDFASPSRFAALGEDPDVAMFFNSCIDARYSARSIALTEALFETAYALMTRVMDAPKTDHEYGFDPLAIVREYTAMFEGEFRGDIVNIWRAFAHDMHSGLGRESAIIVDLNGAMPAAIPGLPKAFSDLVNTPRVTFLAPVANREKLGTAWDTIHQSATRIAERVGKMSESEIPVPSPIRSEAGGLSSWFLPLPFFDDEFLPSVTLDDSWFAVGTSRNHSVDLINRLDALEPRPGGGLRFHVNFQLIAESQREQIAILKENRAAILESQTLEGEEFDAMIEGIKSFVSGLEAFNRLDARYWEEGGTARSRIHLRVNP